MIEKGVFIPKKAEKKGMRFQLHPECRHKGSVTGIETAKGSLVE